MRRSDPDDPVQLAGDAVGDLPGPVLVVGTGLIGTSVGLGLRRRGQPVWLHDASASALQIAVTRGAGVPMPVDPRVSPWLVVVAVPPATTAALIRDVLEAHPAAVVTDVASVKIPIQRELEDAGVDLGRYVGGHPMAGREVSGPAAARADLLFDRPWVITPHEASGTAAVSAVTRLATTVGSLPVLMPADEHDHAVAVISHAPQVLSSVLAAQLLDSSEGTAAIAGQGLRDMTRIAASDPELWRDILVANADEVRQVLKALRSGLDSALGALDSIQAGGAQRIEELLRRGNAGRDRVPGRHGQREKPSVLVPVAVPDRAGELGRLFAAVAEAGASIEDVWIEHVLGRPTGVVEMAVDAELAPVLAAALTDAGWDVRG